MMRVLNKIVGAVGITDTEGADVEDFTARLRKVICSLRRHAEVAEQCGEELSVLHRTFHNIKGIRAEAKGIGYFITDNFYLTLDIFSSS